LTQIGSGADHRALARQRAPPELAKERRARRYRIRRRESMRDMIGYLLPAVLCVFICALGLARWAGSEGAALSPVFFAFLPLCFVMMGVFMWRLDRELGELRRRLQNVEPGRS
jgi:hypothetical protein